MGQRRPWDIILLGKREANRESLFLFETESHFYVLVWNRQWCCNFFSVTKFKIPLQQSHVYLSLEVISKISLRLVEGLGHMGGTKFQRNPDSGIMI